MGQILRPELIKPLTQNSPTQISLPSGSVINIGGQQYKTSAAIVLNLSGLVANGLYMVFAVVSGGVVSLVASQNFNSIGPVGYAAWKLVGAFYANMSLTFGNFVTTDGVPTFSPITMTSIIEAVTSNPTKGTVTTDVLSYGRLGKFMKMTATYVQTTSGTAGSGTYLWKLPTGLTLDANGITIAANRFQGLCGFSVTDTGAGGTRPRGNMVAYDATHLAMTLGNLTEDAEFVASTFRSLSDVDRRYSFDATVPIAEWSNTPLKDL